jgi:hypothetical protein
MTSHIDLPLFWDGYFYYTYDERAARVFRSQYADSPFPRNFISLSGAGLPVHEFDSNLQRHSALATAFTTEIRVPSSVTRIYTACLCCCRDLIVVAFEFGCHLSSIDGHAFWDCVSLPSICLPAGVREIHRMAFARTNLDLVLICDGNSHFEIAGQFLVTAGSAIAKAFFHVHSCEEVKVPSTLAKLNSGCFERSEWLSRVVWFGRASPPENRYIESFFSGVP